MTFQYPPNSSEPGAVAWYFVHEDAQVGPITEAELLDAVNTGKLLPDTLVWQSDFANWVEAIEIPLLATNSLLCETRRQKTLVAPSSRSQDSTSSHNHPIPILSESTSSSPDPVSESVHELTDLGDALTDDEVIESTIDVEQVRELLQRTSTYPPDRSIPPAAYTTPPSNRSFDVIERVARALKKPILWGAGVLSVAITTVVVFLARDGSPNRGNTGPLKSLKSEISTSANRNAPTSFQPKDSLVPETGSSSLTTTESAVVLIESGPLEPALLESKLVRARPVFDEQCWTVYRVPGPSTPRNPSIKVTMSIDRFGNVYDVSSSKAPPSYRGAGLCIIGRIRGWKFPKADRGTQATLTIERFRE